ncbi:AmmeMemoRadiSam system radical SAM enzyme [Neptuniibacter caesariensis]|uniref:Pyruvate formate lyase-activating enzyme PflA n=1 Tax=Neptuniibacter caesariensis TaxID=207954 RepID=A0A7U8C3X7_NEPCE|nr:AmmeMemoRadiSam system radical SAM enzyme [Neptuniibacter caesariensis]EAR60779.1 pyruvate formate lyase-activating enzyme PflA [Neptuniibacter caesariensis]
MPGALTANYPTKFWHSLDKEKVQCDLCPHFCKLKEGQRGLCYIRANFDHQIQLLSWGRSSGFCIDPIEKKPLNHFYPGQPILSFGTAGCNLTCKFCQNWDMSKSRQMDTLSDNATPQQLVEAAIQHNCIGLAFTYNDPVIFMEYALDAISACHEEKLKAVAVSAGFINPAPREQFFSVMDACNIDLKAFSEQFYRKNCSGHLSTVLDTLLYIHHETNCWLEITTLLIPGLNDSDSELEKLCNWIYSELSADVPIHFTAFHPDYKMRDLPKTPLSTLSKAREIALKQGLNYPYTGNAFDPQGNSTFCPECKSLLIGRNWYEITAWNLDKKGQCKNCGYTAAGVYTENPGDWGRKRELINIREY